MEVVVTSRWMREYINEVQALGFRRGTGRASYIARHPGVTYRGREILSLGSFPSLRDKNHALAVLLQSGDG